MIQVHKNEGKFFWILKLAAHVGFLFLLTGCGSRLEPAQLHSGGEHVGEIRGDHTVGQTFVTQHDGLQSVDVLLATFARSNTHAVTFHLRADPQSDTDLRSVTVATAEIADNAFQRFSFAPIADSHHRRYYFFIDSPDSQAGDAITAWTGLADDFRGGSLYVEGQAQEGQLVFRLSYSNVHIVLGLIRDLVTGLPVALATVALLLLPGLALLLWLAPIREWDRLLTAIVAAGLSAAAFPLLLLVSRLVRLRWSSGVTWLFLLFCLGLIVLRLWRWSKTGVIQVQWPGWKGFLSQSTLELWLFWAVVLAVLGVRWFVVRPLSVPLWGDSHQHTYIAQLMVEHGGLFDSWEPYSPYDSFSVHFGFHAAVAFFHWVTGMGVLRAVIVVGQIFNGLAVLALYPLALRISGRLGARNAGGRWVGITAVLVAGLLMPLPMEYVNWGRYPQLAGQMILLVALWLFWFLAESQRESSWKLAILAAVAAAGMALTYYRMPYYFAAFVLAWLLCFGVAEWRGDRRRWLALVGRVLMMGVIALLLVSSWGAKIVGGRLATSLAKAVQATPLLERVLNDYRIWQDIERYVPRYLIVLFLVGLLLSLVRRRWTVALLGLWTAFLASLVAARLIHLPGASHMQSFAIIIALYMPVGLMVGWLIGWLVSALSDRWGNWGKRFLGVLLLASTVFGFKERMAVVDPAYALVDRADEVAMEWIRVNAPADATFLVNGFLIYDGRYAAGSDAGWWIPLLAGRQNTMPPQYALFNEDESIPGYGRAIVQLVADLEKNRPTTSVGLEKLCENGVTHIYVGQGQGRVALEELTPFLIPADLAASPYYDLIYHQDRIWIFALKDNVCP